MKWNISAQINLLIHFLAYLLFKLRMNVMLCITNFNWYVDSKYDEGFHSFVVAVPL